MPTKAKKAAPKKSSKYKEVSFADEVAGEEAGRLWQLYRSREMFRASQFDHPFELEGKTGDAGDWVAWDPENGYRLISAEEVAAFQPIADSERAKV